MHTILYLQGTQLASLSPGFVYEPYAPRERISFWKRLVTVGTFPPLNEVYNVLYACLLTLPSHEWCIRWFTRGGWRRTKEDIIIEVMLLVSAYPWSWILIGVVPSFLWAIVVSHSRISSFSVLNSSCFSSLSMLHVTSHSIPFQLIPSLHYDFLVIEN